MGFTVHNLHISVNSLMMTVVNKIIVLFFPGFYLGFHSKRPVVAFEGINGLLKNK